MNNLKQAHVKVENGYTYLADLDGNRLPNGIGYYVGGGVYLPSNQLTNVDGLKGCTFGGGVYLNNNQLTNVDGLKGCTFGGGVYLSSNQLTNVDGLKGCTFGGGVNLNNNQLTNTPEIHCSSFDDFLVKGFVFADGILTHLIKKRGNIYTTKKLVKDEIIYVIKKGEYFAHGKTIKKAREALLFKTADRDTSAYEGLPLDTVKTPMEWAVIYSVITGSCETGCRMFMESKGKLKAKYSLKEIIKETDGAYQSHVFKEFFKEK